MKYIKHLFLTILMIGSISVVSLIAPPSDAYAVECSSSNLGSCTNRSVCENAGGVYTSGPTGNVCTRDASTTDDALQCGILPQNLCDSAKVKGDVERSGVFQILIFVLRILTAGVGIVAVGAIVYAGILYTSAGDSNEQVNKAKKMITDTAIGIVVYALMFLILNWLIPGGVIGG